MIATLSYFTEMSITAISFYWRNDTPSFATWRSRLATAPDTRTCIVIHGGQLTGGVHPPNQFAPETVSTLPCPRALVRHILLIVYFKKKKNLFLSSAPLTNATKSVFNALIVHVTRTWIDNKINSYHLHIVSYTFK